jgi:hypothetical protein
MRRYRIPPIVSDLILTALRICDETVFDLYCHCPFCGGEGSGYDLRKRRFAGIRDGERNRVIIVHVRRYLCQRCNRTFLCDAPFYPDTRTGSPVIDLCVTFASHMPYYRVSSILEEVGVIVDRGSVRFYALQGRNVKAEEMFGVRLPVSVILLASLAAGTGYSERISGSDILAACGYPSGMRGKSPDLSDSTDRGGT